LTWRSPSPTAELRERLSHHFEEVADRLEAIGSTESLEIPLDGPTRVVKRSRSVVQLLEEEEAGRQAEGSAAQP
jgi:hypothetical protein